MVDKPMKTLTAGDVRYIITDQSARDDLAALDTKLKGGQLADAALHLGFYLDENR